MVDHTTEIWQSRLADYALGRLDNESFAEVELHLESCSACQAMVSDAKFDDPLTQLLRSASEVTSVDGQWLPLSSELLQLNEPSNQHARCLKPFEHHPRYELIRPLGRGGMGLVWLAKHQFMNRMVAIKVIRSDLSFDPEIVERFRREVIASAVAVHPNIVVAFDAENIDDQLCLISEFVDGENLIEALKQRTFTVEESAKIILQAAQGLAHAHGRGLVHGDITPRNLMIDQAGTLKILDFGLAKLTLDPPATVGHGSVAGTLRFMSPEQRSGQIEVDHRSDIYSLGQVWRLLMEHESRNESTGDVADVSLPAILPKALRSILQHMLADAPHDRYATTRELVADLKNWLRSYKVAGMETEKRQLSLSRRMTIALGAVAAVVGLSSWLRYRLYPTQPIADESSAVLSPADRELAQADSVVSVLPRDVELLWPTSIGDGTSQDFEIKDKHLILKSTGPRGQIWLNYENVRAPILKLSFRFRILEQGERPILKVSLLSNSELEYNTELYMASPAHIVINRDDSQGLRICSSQAVTDGLTNQWHTWEVVLDEKEIRFTFDQKTTITTDAPTSGNRYPCLAARGCIVELDRPLVTIG